MKEEGIKFNCRWMDEKPVNYKLLKELNSWRSKLYGKKLIGAYEDGTGFGNMSIRLKRNHFIITGTATGKLQKLNARHYTTVTEFNLDKNRVTCIGPLKASSESLTHAMIYYCHANVQAVVHVHHFQLWKKLLNRVPTTKATVAYGTIDMAKEVRRLFEQTDVADQKVIAMAGHEEGIITFGNNIEEASLKILSLLNEYLPD